MHPKLLWHSGCKPAPSEASTIAATLVVPITSQAPGLRESLELLSRPMNGGADRPDQYGPVRVQVLARTDYMDAEQRELIDELPNYLRAEGFEPDIFYREPGGRGAAPLEEIVLYLGQNMAAGGIGSATWAAVAALTRWARKRIQRQRPSTNSPNQEPSMTVYVSVNIYSGEGAHLTNINITADDVVQPYAHPAIAKAQKGPDTLPKDMVTLEPNARGYLAVATDSGSISCLVQPAWIACETPAANWPLHEDGTPYHSVKCNADGSIEWADGQMGDLPRTTIGDAVYRALGWKIMAVEEGLRFTNDETGHGVYVTTQKVEGF